MTNKYAGKCVGCGGIVGAGQGECKKGVDGKWFVSHAGSCPTNGTVKPTPTNGDATFTKLPNGSWGLKGRGITSGQHVVVALRSGETRIVTVGEILRTENGVDFASLDSSGAGRRAGRNGCSCDCEECSGHCRCDAHCNCRGGNIYDC